MVVREKKKFIAFYCFFRHIGPYLLRIIDEEANFWLYKTFVEKKLTNLILYLSFFCTLFFYL